MSRLTPLKRADLLIRALATPPTDAASAWSSPVKARSARRSSALAGELGVADRVQFTGRVSDEQLLDLLASCRAVCFPPFQEDYGFVTVEAFASRKAVVTCRDSGGPAELVADGVTGFVCDPTPEALAHACARWPRIAPLAERMGGEALAAGARLTWPETVRQLMI